MNSCGDVHGWTEVSSKYFRIIEKRHGLESEEEREDDDLQLRSSTNTFGSPPSPLSPISSQGHKPGHALSNLFLYLLI
jgi:hypothetical protein